MFSLYLNWLLIDFVATIAEDDKDNVVLEVGDDIDLGSFGDVNIDDRSNAQSGGVGTSNNENEDEDAWLMEGLPRN